MSEVPLYYCGLVSGLRFPRDLCRARGEQLDFFKDICLKNGSSQGQNLALTVLFVPNSLDSSEHARFSSPTDTHGACRFRAKREHLQRF